MLPIVAHEPDPAPGLHHKHPRGRPGRHLHARLLRHRPALLTAGYVGALLAVVGPGVLAGLSDDDPAGITTYSILGAKYGYELLWVLAVSSTQPQISSVIQNDVSSLARCCLVQLTELGCRVVVSGGRCDHRHPSRDAL